MQLPQYFLSTFAHWFFYERIKKRGASIKIDVPARFLCLSLCVLENGVAVLTIDTQVHLTIKKNLFLEVMIHCYIFAALGNQKPNTQNSVLAVLDFFFSFWYGLTQFVNSNTVSWINWDYVDFSPCPGWCGCLQTQLWHLHVFNFYVNLLPLFRSIVPFHITFACFVYQPHWCVMASDTFGFTLLLTELCLYMFVCVCNQTLKAQRWNNFQILEIQFNFITECQSIILPNWRPLLPHIHSEICVRKCHYLWLNQAINLRKVPISSEVWCMFFLRFLLLTKWFELTCSSLVCK